MILSALAHYNPTQWQCCPLEGDSDDYHDADEENYGWMIMIILPALAHYNTTQCCPLEGDSDH